MPTLALGGAAGAADTTLSDAISDGQYWVDLRYRFEQVKQTGFSRNANASTLRTQFGYETGTFAEFNLFFELETNLSIGAANYNDTVDRRLQFPVVADPEGIDFNQGYLRYRGRPDTDIRFGRQALNLDNQRFLGSVAFRQNEQTFDSITLTTTAIPAITLRYGFIVNVNRIFGDDSPVGTFDSRSHYVNANHTFGDIANLVGYAYLLDLREAPRLSSATYGGRLTGRYVIDSESNFGLRYAAEGAHQTDHARNPAQFSGHYILLEPAVFWGPLTAFFGYEVLSGDGANAVQMPLATLHLFQGLTDIFLLTPPDGIEDIYGKIQFKTPSGNGLTDSMLIEAVYHEFAAENVSRRYGSEWSFKVAKQFLDQPFDGKVGLSLEVASYRADTFGVDTRKIWITLNYKM